MPEVRPLALYVRVRPVSARRAVPVGRVVRDHSTSVAVSEAVRERLASTTVADLAAETAG